MRLQAVEVGTGDPFLEDNRLDSIIFIGATRSVKRSCTRHTMLFEVGFDTFLVQCRCVASYAEPLHSFRLQELAFRRTHEHDGVRRTNSRLRQADVVLEARVAVIALVEPNVTASCYKRIEEHINPWISGSNQRL